MHETHLALAYVTVLRGNLRAHLKAHVTNEEGYLTLGKLKCYGKA